VNKTYKKHVFILYHEVFASRVGWIEEHVFFWVCPVEGVVRRKEKGGYEQHVFFPSFSGQSGGRKEKGGYEEHVFFLLFLDRVEGGRRKVGMKNMFFFLLFLDRVEGGRRKVGMKNTFFFLLFLDIYH